jgi:hypothetical protein
MTPARAALGVCGLGLVIALLVVLGQRQTQIASTDRVDNNAFVIGVPGGSRLCQEDEIVPSGTVALRMTIGTYGTPGPSFRFTITVPRRHGGGRRLLAAGALPYGWKQGVVSIPIAPHVHGAYGDATVCMDNLGKTNVALAGSTVLGDYGFNDYLNGHYVLTEARIDYLLPGRPSWFDMIGTIAERMTLGKGSYVGWAGWIAPLLLMIAVVVLVVRVLAAEERRRVRRTRAAAARRLAALRRLLARLPRAAAARRLAALRRVLARLPRAAYVCALIALLNTLAWSVIVPPFEVPDENAHYAYVQLLVENGRLPQATAVFNGLLSPREDAILEVIHAFRLPGQPENPAPITSVDQSMIQQVESEHLSARGTGSAISASANPPLYYALEAVPYALSPSGSVLDRLAQMRVLSAVFAGLTVLFAFLFLRELMPGTPWAWTVGALAVALQPLFAFISSGLNNDSLLYTFAAALFYTLARMFRRGLTQRRGLAIGGVLGAGLLVKFNLLAFAPAVALALAIGAWRAGRLRRLISARAIGWVALLATVPSILYLELSGRVVTPGGIGATGAATVAGAHFSIRQEAYHTWELFLPNLPFMGRDFPTVQLWNEWFQGLVGRFGWLDTVFPYWVYLLAAAIAIPLGLAALADLARERSKLRRHLGELLVYVVMVAGLCIEIGVESYRTLITGGGVFEQPRYVLPGLCIYAAIVALAVRLPGRRWGIALGSVLVMLFLAHDLFSELQVIARYYA